MMNSIDSTSDLLANARIRFLDLPFTSAMRAQIGAFLAQVNEQSKIDGVDLVFAHEENRSPAYRVTLHLAVPGPDMRMEHAGATIAEAWQKVSADVFKRLRRRDAKRVASRKRSEPRRMVA